MAHELKVDPKRVANKRIPKTGLLATVTHSDGGVNQVDIATLDRDSLHAWLTQTGDNLFAVNTVMVLLNHHQIVPELPA